mgnify:FL=1
MTKSALNWPGQQPCAYYLVTSDQDSTFDFLASLFLSFAFIKLVRYADANCPGGRLPVPVHVLGEELTMDFKLGSKSVNPWPLFQTSGGLFWQEKS